MISHDSETPAHGQQIFSVAAFIHHNFNGKEKVFLPKRAKTKKFLPDIFELPGGHVNFGEDMILGLKREVREENEVEISVGDPFYVFTYQNQIKGSHSIEVIYFATFTSSIETIRIHPEDHSEFRWVAEDEIHEILQCKDAEDPELKAIKRGFELLKGGQLNFG